MIDFSAALDNDTSLYGIPPYDCAWRGNVSRFKKDKIIQALFPGYCSEALQAAIKVARNHQCTKQVCNCPVMLDTVIFKVAGMANEKFCGKVCVDVLYSCPQHIWHSWIFRWLLLPTIWSSWVHLQNHQKYQYPTSNVDIIKSQATETVDKILQQVNIASYVYIGYSCLATFFSTLLTLFQAPHWASIKQALFGVQKPYFIITTMSMW